MGTVSIKSKAFLNQFEKLIKSQLVTEYSFVKKFDGFFDCNITPVEH